MMGVFGEEMANGWNGKGTVGSGYYDCAGHDRAGKYDQSEGRRSCWDCFLLRLGIQGQQCHIPKVGNPAANYVSQMHVINNAETTP